MSEFLFITSELWKGNSLLRAYLNYRLKEERLEGKSIDVGGGVGAQWLEVLPRNENAELRSFDLKTGDTIDFESDSLPATDGFYDTVLFLNVMEHVFNYQHIANEVVRVTKPGGRLIGFVPFLMWYHPDHRDFFRYTHEALELILSKAGAKNIVIEPIVRGPFTVAAHMTILLVPRVLRALYFAPLFVLDKLFLKFQRNPDKRHALGYFFVTTK